MLLTNTRKTLLSRALLATGLSLSLAACAGGEAPDELSAPGLAQVDIPDGFDFATTHAVALEVRTERATPVAVEVSNVEGHVLFRGPLSKDAPLRRSFALPTAAKTVTVTLVDGAHRESAALNINGARATHQF